MMQRRQASAFYPHFEPEERPTIDYFVGLFNRLIFKHQAILTHFLDPREREILETVVGGEALLQEFGGYQAAEKKRVYLSEDWENLKPDDYKIVLYQIDYPQKFAQLRHGQILGSLANSGVEVATFGDIVTDGQGTWQFFAEAELSDFFDRQIDRIGRTRVRLHQVPLKELTAIEDNSVTESAVASSMRLDALLAAVTGKSRSQLKDAFTAGDVKLNWHEEAAPEKIAAIGDMISLRHFGRLQISDVKPTKKGRLHLDYQLWRSGSK